MNYVGKKSGQSGTLAERECIVPGVTGGRSASGNFCEAVRHDETGLYHKPTALQGWVVQGNPRVYKALRDKFEEVIAELKRIEKGGDVRPELTQTIEFMSIIMNGMKEDMNGL